MYGGRDLGVNLWAAAVARAQLEPAPDGPGAFDDCGLRGALYAGRRSSRTERPMNQTLVVVLIAAAVAIAAMVRMRGGEGRVDGAQARALVAEGAQLVDVRTPGEFGGGHIEGAVNIPVHEVAARAGELDRERPVVVYCQSGMRSAGAARALRAAGFTAVHDLGSIGAW